MKRLNIKKSSEQKDQKMVNLKEEAARDCQPWKPSNNFPTIYGGSNLSDSKIIKQYKFVSKCKNLEITQDFQNYNKKENEH